jgi:hypothetical protein
MIHTFEILVAFAVSAAGGMRRRSSLPGRVATQTSAFIAGGRADQLTDRRSATADSSPGRGVTLARFPTPNSPESVSVPQIFFEAGGERW